MSLATYEEARPWAKAIKEELLEKRMPPWHAVKGYGDFRNVPPLTQREIDMIVNWVEGGAPRGDPRDLPEEPLFSDDWPLGKPDLILQPEAEYTIASDADEHRALLLPAKLKKDAWIRAIDLKPGNGSVVHCATFYVEKSDDRRKVKQSSAPSVFETLGSWAPGQKAVAFPDGIARLLPADSQLTVRIHYRGSGETVKDRSAVGLYLSKSTVSKQVQEISIANSDVVIPAGAAPHQVNASLTVQGDTEAIAIRPLVHPLLISLEATAYRPDDTVEVLIWTRGYRYDWQPTYHFKRPVALPKGTRIEVIAHFDNSEDNQNNPNNPPKQARLSDLITDGNALLSISVTQSTRQSSSPSSGR